MHPTAIEGFVIAVNRGRLVLRAGVQIWSTYCSRHALRALQSFGCLPTNGNLFQEDCSFSTRLRALPCLLQGAPRTSCALPKSQRSEALRHEKTTLGVQIYKAFPGMRRGLRLARSVDFITAEAGGGNIGAQEIEVFRECRS